VYTEDNEGHVIITLNRQDYDSLLLCLGFASGSAMKEGSLSIADSFLRLANSINYGNPYWTPYETSNQAYD